MTGPRDLRLKSQRFRDERQNDWRDLEHLLQRAEGGVIKRLDETQIVRLTVLYRAALSSLSVARATSLDKGLIDYLESLSARAYFFVYGVRATPLERVTKFFAHDWPQAARDLWRETLVAAVLTVVAIAVAWVLVAQDPDWYFAIMPEAMAQGREPSASTAFLKSTLYAKKNERDFLGLGAAMLFTNNAGVAILAFALGFAFCVPTALLIVVNGLNLGAMLELFWSRGLGPQFTGWLSIHGTTELFAIMLAGGAGFRVGLAVAFPGAETRVVAAGRAGRQGATLVMGAVIMLVIAALLEGVGRQVVTLDWARYAIGGVVLLIWLAYLYLPRSARRMAAHV